MTPFNSPEWDEIICIMFEGKRMVLGEKAIQLLNDGYPVMQLFSRAEFRLLTYFDMGDKWARYADMMPTLFRRDSSEANRIYTELSRKAQMESIV